MPTQELLTVHTEQKDYTLSQLKEDVDSYDIITNPEYQRKYVYDDKRASMLIESILIGIPIPIIYLCEESDGVYSVIDGQQRIVSFVRYLKNEFALTGLRKLTDLNDLFYRDLPKDIQRKLKSKTLHAITITKDSANLKYEIFSRLNLGAVKLRDQEVRNCIYRGSFNDMLKSIADSNATLKAMFHDDNKRFAYEERILRFFALRDYLNLHGTFKVTMNAFMEKHQNDDDAQISKYRSQFNSVLDTVKCVLGDGAFYSTKRKKFNGAVYDSIMIPFSFFPSRTLLAHADVLRTRITHLKENDSEYQNNIYVGTNSGPRVRGRIEQILHIINDTIKSDHTTDEVRIFPPEIKQQLFTPNYRCSYCGNEILSIDDCEVDHIVPFSRGGRTTIENAQLLHKQCNKHKGNTIVAEPIDDMIDDSDDE